MNPFDCVCGHSVSRHTEKRWPSFTPLCRDCDCGGYQPIYKNGNK